MGLIFQLDDISQIYVRIQCVYVCVCVCLRARAHVCVPACITLTSRWHISVCLDRTAGRRQPLRPVWTVFLRSCTPQLSPASLHRRRQRPPVHSLPSPISYYHLHLRRYRIPRVWLLDMPRCQMVETAAATYLALRRFRNPHLCLLRLCTIPSCSSIEMVAPQKTTDPI